MHPTTGIMTVAWKEGTRKTLRQAPVHTWSPDERAKHRADHSHEQGLKFWRTINRPNVILVAHNAPFEQAITRNVLPKMLKLKGPIMIAHERFVCTASMAAACALPQKLEHLAAALELPHQKDMEGHRIMLQLSKPRKASKNNSDTKVRDPIKFDKMVNYCVSDIDTEVEAFLTVPMLSPNERRVWLLDQEINFAGFAIDRPLVKRIIELIKEENVILTKELIKLTNGVVKTVGQTKVLLSWLKRNGCFLPDMTKKTVEDAIKDGLATGVCKRVLEIRLALSKTSTAKYPMFLLTSESDGRTRFSIRYHAASTGRFGGQGLQPHNFPRGTVKTPEGEDLAVLAADYIAKGADLETIRMLFGDPMEVFASCLRTCIIATPGWELFVSDFAAIEARVLFWMADHEEGVEAFHQNRKMYEEMAMAIFGLSDILEVTKDQRFVGKEAVLGSGFGMGWKKFQATCLQKGREVTTETAKKAINAYRREHAAVPRMWKNLENAAIAAVKNPSKTYSVNHTEWFMKGKFLCCRLPSGRLLRYYGPSIRYEETQWGDKKATLYTWGVNSKTKKWKNEKTWGGVLTENVVQAMARDLMVEAMFREKEAGYSIRLTVHDELIAERKKNTGGSAKDFEFIMRQVPAWAEGCPVNVEGWSGERYRK